MSNTRHTSHNVVTLLDDNAHQRGDAPMFVFTDRDERAFWNPGDALSHKTISWTRVADDAARVAAGLAELGVVRGDRVVVFVPMSPALYTILAAIQRIAAIPVVLESWIGKSHLDDGVASVAPKAIVAPEMALAMCALVPACARIPLKIGVGTCDVDSLRENAGVELAATFESLLATDTRAPIAAVSLDDTGLITFTTGSSGTPKGANRTHRFLRAQHEAIDAHLPYVAGDVDLPVFPIFCLNSAAAGVTTVLPAVDAGHPSDDDAALLATQIESCGVTSTTLNPGLLRSLARYAIERRITFASLRRVVVGGAPVGASDVALMKRMAPKAAMTILYGSTEVEPICHIDGDELIASEARGVDGVCAGKPTPGLRVKLLNPTRDNIALDARGFTPLEVETGEIVVAGAHVCDGYWKNDDAFARAKIRDRGGVVWHRTGDVGRFDDDGRLWIVGRVHTAVRRNGATIFPVGVECALRALPWVKRAAYVGVPDATLGERAVVAIELLDGRDGNDDDVRAAGKSCGVPVDDIAYLAALPMDARHHSKVEVERLRDMLIAMDATSRRTAA